IPDPLTKAFQSASSVASGEFYLIGSAVRKCILGEPGFCDDIDFMGAFDLDRIQNHFGNQVVRRWDQFRTIKVLQDDLEIDFISDTNIREALEKRDITLSLMCIDRNGIVYDPLNYIDDLRKKIIRIEDAEQKTRAGHSFAIGIALSYGGRVEILNAIHRISKEKLETISEEEFSKLLWTKDIPDPDIIIRTSGEKRTSGFLPWQGVYSELFFTDTFWPAFTREEFDRILGEYGKRERRLGK
ncbi:MAG: undecaprenyl diphosphate synthase family protein, partial [Candidatus Uhrbacteria bacterium]|nr:undecaprenyl diphosphate synthase family protein [Candidatus Uhrbacteria bacterium]